MAGETIGEQQTDDRICPLGRLCVEGMCPGRQQDLGFVEGGIFFAKGTMMNVMPDIVAWCGQEEVPGNVRAYRQFMGNSD